VSDADRLADALVLGELIRRDPPVHREMELGWPQVLADRDDVASGVGEILQRAWHLVRALAHP
jgi:hypothetical protein